MVKLHKYEANPFQDRVFHALRTEKRIIACFAGWRTGKTDYTAFDHVINRQVGQNPDVLHAILANTYSQLRDSTLRTLFAKLDQFGIPHIPDKLPRSNGPTSLYILNRARNKWVEFLCRSMDNVDILSGVTLGSAWGDEMWGTDSWSLDLIDSRLSDKNSKHLQFLITSTKDEPDHWLYTNIVQPWENNAELKNGSRARDIIEIVEGTTYDNEKNLVDGYISSKQATLEPRLFQRFIENKWVSAAEGRAYPYFDLDTHLKRLDLEPDFPLIACLDFDVNPCVWVLGQSLARGSYFDREIVQRDTDVWKVCGELKRELVKISGSEDGARERRVVFYGDYQHGTGRSLSATAGAWSIVEGEFRGWNAEFRRKSNPRIIDRVNATNARMRSADGSVKLWLSPDCRELRKDYELVTWDDLRNHAGSDRTHAASAVDYFHNYEFPCVNNVSRYG